MSTQLLAIFAVLGLALLILLVGWSALAVSEREEEEQQRWIEKMRTLGLWPPSANWDYPADGPDTSNGSESDHAD